MNVTQEPNEVQSEAVPGTLGAVLYANGHRATTLEKEWIALVRSIAEGNQRALHALYERAHRPVFTLIMRIVSDRQTAEELTLDVFHDVWRRAPSYVEDGGSVLGWIMNQARSRAIDRLRHQQRKKRVSSSVETTIADGVVDGSEDLVASQQQFRHLRQAMACLTPGEREAIELAFFSDCTYVEVAGRLDQPAGTIKTRIRSGLSKLRLALTKEER